MDNSAMRSKGGKTMRSRSLQGLLLLAIVCIPSVASADPLIPWPWLEANRYFTWRKERDSRRADWYARRALDPVGTRRTYSKGKFWPPYPRPEGLAMLPSHRFHAEHYWPLPYVCDDRQYVRTLISRQEDAGWMDNTTLYDYHFESDTHELNRSGRLHVMWVIRNAPQHRRILYVQTAENLKQTDIRLASTRAATGNMVGATAMPPVIPRVTSPLGRPALEVDAIQRADRDSQPVPRISPPLGGGGGGGGGGAGAAAGI